jgi:carbonic anhydrase/acetyltransferase-like protein (isoleucine patch superfamily)
MPLVTQFHPEQVHPSVFIAPGAVVVGDVTLGEQASVWFNATLRGDVESITVGRAATSRRAASCTPTPATRR